jgi:raffinose/stachyose/melibiose transport system permease protein
LTFDYIYLLTGGGPAHATEMLSTYAYTLGFSSFLVGRASAVGIVMSSFGLVAAVFYTWLSRRDIAA